MSAPLAPDDSAYCDALLNPIRTCVNYKPKLGTKAGVDISSFHAIYGVDPLYHWMGFDSDLMYAAHKAAGGMTSLYRQLGIGCERLFRLILRDTPGLSADQVAWSYQKAEGTRTRTLSLDGRIRISDVADQGIAGRIGGWIEDQSRELGVRISLHGAVFEVRQGYKSADSKRQNADLANASQALGDGYLPVLAIMSSQVNQAVKTRYEVGNWAVLMGITGENDPFRSSFDFMREIIGYDIESFFRRNNEYLRGETEFILKSLLEAR